MISSDDFFSQNELTTMSNQKSNPPLFRVSGNSTRPHFEFAAAVEGTPLLQTTPRERPTLLVSDDLTSHLWSRLQGSWVGLDGFNLVAVPSRGSKPTDFGDFLLITMPYIETLTFTDPGAPAPNRGGDTDQFVAALEYHQRVTSNPGPDYKVGADNDSPTFRGELLHVETGMFLNLTKTIDNQGNPAPVNGMATDEDNFVLARSGTIPHGDSIMILGKAPELSAGRPQIDNIGTLPTHLPPFPASVGYREPYEENGKLDNPKGNPALVLRNHLDVQEKAEQKITNTVSFSFDSNNGGAVTNIPFIMHRANATRVQAFFWLETVRIAATGQEFDQLQYAQIIDLEFHHFEQGKDALIGWPHVTVNTLVKQ